MKNSLVRSKEPSQSRVCPAMVITGTASTPSGRLLLDRHVAVLSPFLRLRPMPTSKAMVAFLAVFGCLLPSYGFVYTSLKGTREQPRYARSTCHISESSRCAPCHSRKARWHRRKQWSASDEGTRCGSRLTPQLRAGADVDDIDPLEAGSDIDPLEAGPDVLAIDDVDGAAPEMEGSNEDVGEAVTVVPEVIPKRRRARRSVKPEEDDADAAVLAALAAGDNEEAEKLMNKRKKRRRADPFMPRNSPEPNEWAELSPIKEGCRGHLVVFHTGLPKDRAVAQKFASRVTEKFGDHINVFETFDEDDETTLEERQESKAFEIWLEGPEVVMYHARGESGLDLTEEDMDNILLDLADRVSDEAILTVHGCKTPPYRMPGFTPREMTTKTFYPI